MRAFLAIVRLTCRSAIRSHFFHGLLVIFLCAVFLIPLVIQSDGTAVGWIRITLEYSFGLIAAILSLSAVWLAGSEITADVADARIHMIASKPVSMPLIYLAKYTGVLVIHAALLLFAGAVVYGLTMYRVATTDFEPGEREQLNEEVLTARRVYKPDSQEESIRREAEEKLDSMMKETQARGKEIPDEFVTVKDKFGNFSREEGLKRMCDTIRTARLSTDPRGGVHEWSYSGLPEKEITQNFRVRYKLYHDMGTTTQDSAYGVFGWKYHFPASDGSHEFQAREVFFMNREGTPLQMATGMTAEVAVNHPFKPDSGVKVIQEDGKGYLLFQNFDATKKLQILPEDGPLLLVPMTGFFSNYLRGLLMSFFGIAFFACLGLSFSACLSLPIGMFLTGSYALLSWATEYLLDLFLNTAVSPHSTSEWIGFYGSLIVKVLLVNPGDFSVAGSIASGELVEWSLIGSVFLFHSLVRTMPIFLLGLYFYRRRELATSVKV